MEKRIFYHDTDAGGVVYYGNYLKYLEEARTEFLEKKGLSVKYMHAQGFLYAVRKCTITYKAPARYGDVIICDAVLKELTAAQFVFDQAIRDKKSGDLLVEAEVNLVSLNRDFKPIQIPADIKGKLS